MVDAPRSGQSAAGPAAADPRPFLLAGGPVGVLLLHGFTGSPAEMRPLGEALHQRGLTVSGPCLPGHGTAVDDLEPRTWREWIGHAEAALHDLRASCRKVFVAGQSLGSLVVLHLAAEHRDLAGVVVYAPPLRLRDRRSVLLPLARRFLRRVPKTPDAFHDARGRARLWAYDTLPLAAAHEVLRLTAAVRRLLPRVTCPVLLVHSTADPILHPRSAALLRERVGAATVEVLTLHRSGHVVTLDAEWEAVAERTWAFIAAHAGRSG